MNINKLITINIILYLYKLILLYINVIRSEKSGVEVNPVAMATEAVAGTPHDLK